MIRDFGQKIDGAAKDRWRAFLDRMDMVRDGDVLTEPLSRSFPEPNYVGLMREGADPWTLGVVRALRDILPPKPRSFGAAAWGRTVVTLRSVCRDLLSGNLSATTVFSRIQDGAMRQRLTDLVDLYAVAGHERSLKDLKIAHVAYSLLDGVRHNPPLQRFEIIRGKTRFNNEPLVHARTREDLLERYRVHLALQAAASREGPTEAAEARAIKFSLYRMSGPGASRDVIIGKKIGSRHIDLHHCPDLATARAYLRDHHAELVERLERMKTPPCERGSENAPRSGIDPRGGRDVSPEEFMETFAFRGVQFGNYVEQARRQQDLNDSWDALTDLARVLDVEPSALSLQGRLGLAFGARGKGGIGAAAAHYEPLQVVINLTKTRGAGSLAHEWFHALDNVIARLDGSATAYATEKAPPVSEPARAMRGIMAAIRATGIPERSGRLDQIRSTAYWSTGREMAARAFEAWVVHRLATDGIRNDYLAKIASEAVYEAEAALMGLPGGRYPYPTEAEIGAIDQAFGSALDAGVRAILGQPVTAAAFRIAVPDAMPPRKSPEVLRQPSAPDDAAEDALPAPLLPWRDAAEIEDDGIGDGEIEFS